MDKYGVGQVKKMQRAALLEVKERLAALERTHTKTASDQDELARLQRQKTDLEEAIAAPDPEQ